MRDYEMTQSLEQRVSRLENSLSEHIDGCRKMWQNAFIGGLMALVLAIIAAVLSGQFKG